MSATLYTPPTPEERFPLMDGACLFVDTETSGLPDKGEYSNPEHPNTPHLVELGAILTDENGLELACLHRIIKPEGYVISDEVAKVHGITQERALAEGVPLWLAMWELDRLVTWAKFLIAHNHQFDRLVLKGAHHRFRELDRVCTMQSSTKVCQIPNVGRGGYKWPKLVEAHQFFFGEDFEGAHGAIADARACARVYFELKKRGVL